MDKKFTLRTDEEFLRFIHRIAKRNLRSSNAEVIYCLKEYYKHDKRLTQAEKEEFLKIAEKISE